MRQRVLDRHVKTHPQRRVASAIPLRVSVAIIAQVGVTDASLDLEKLQVVIHRKLHVVVEMLVRQMYCGDYQRSYQVGVMPKSHNLGR